MDNSKRIALPSLLAVFTLMACDCSNTIHHPLVLPPPRPVNYSGAAGNPDWLSKQQQVYEQQGVSAPDAALTARLQFESQATGQTDSINPRITQTVEEPKNKKSSKLPKEFKGKLGSDLNKLFYAPPLPALPVTPAPSPSPQPTASVIPEIPLAPVATPDNTQQSPGFPGQPPSQ